MAETPAPTNPPAAPETARGEEAIGDRIAALAEGTFHEFDVFAPQLDPRWFNTGRLHRALGSFATRHRHNRARLLVEDAAQAVRDNNRLVELARRLSDFVEIRQVGESDRGLRELFVLADRNAVLHQQDVTRVEAIVETGGRRAGAELRMRFQGLWDRSEPIPEIRTTGL